MSIRFASYTLRTLDVPAASAFYDAVLGHHGDVVYPLHEQAVARGARPHWLAHVTTPEPDSLGAAWLAEGAQQLGPRPGGGLVMREPAGALLALGPVATPSIAGVVWHVLRTDDAGAVDRYARLFGWVPGPSMDVGSTGYRTLAYGPGEPAMGAVGALEPGVHPQWLCFFGVASLDRAFETALAHGATGMRGELPDGRRFAVCDDPQGAAFGMME
ncbi:MAG: hypothetical protein R3F61_20225 [Myxococcota bacterium]